MKALSDAKLNYLIQKFKSWVNDTFCLKSHTHDVSKDSTGILKPENGGTGVNSLDSLKSALNVPKFASDVLTKFGEYRGRGRGALHFYFEDTFFPEMLTITNKDSTGGMPVTFIFTEKDTTYRMNLLYGLVPAYELISNYDSDNDSFGDDLDTALDDTYIEYFWDTVIFAEGDHESIPAGSYNRITIGTGDDVKYAVNAFNQSASDYRYFVLGRSTIDKQSKLVHIVNN